MPKEYVRRDGLKKWDLSLSDDSCKQNWKSAVDKIANMIRNPISKKNDER
jgi:hypothetical protein